MHRFYRPPGTATGDHVALSESEAVHASRVLRVQPGEIVMLLDGVGGQYEGEVAAVGRREVTVDIRRRLQHAPRGCAVTLLQAVAKTKAMDGLLQKAVELGVSRVIPLNAARCVSQPDDAGDKRDKWQAIAIEAAKQSGNPWLMRIEDPVTPERWIARHEPVELLLIGSLLDPPRTPRAVFEEFRRAQGRHPTSVGVIIGPEGDFSADEYEAFRVAGAKSITLGPLILRVETAVAASVAVIQHELANGIPG